ncbi:MAG: hypothetical protein AB7G75_31280 [Candidatus Binatia bacterium]
MRSSIRLWFHHRVPGGSDTLVMDLYEVIDQIVVLLQQRGRVAYCGLKYQFKLDDEATGSLKDELIDAQRLAVDEAGKVLVWTGRSRSESRV